ncbi:TPA: hypothetical protein ACGCAJ_004745 [Serratia marcescens]
MSLEHKSVVRMQDEYLCTYCGKSWDINDAEPPACLADNEVSGTGIPVYDPPRRDLTADSPTGRVMSSGTQRYRGNPQNIPRHTDDSKRIVMTIRDALLPDGTWVTFSEEDPARAVAYAIHYNGYATIIYANSLSMALGFFGRTMGHTLTPAQLDRIGIDRFSAMDEYCTGRFPRVEMNPNVMAAASDRITNHNRQYTIVNITTFANQLRASK